LLVRSVAHSAHTRLVPLLTMNYMHILEKTTHYDIRLKGTNWDRFFHLWNVLSRLQFVLESGPRTRIWQKGASLVT